MAKEKGGFSEVSRKGQVKQVNRGTQDELEILGLVIAELPVQRQLVLDKLRAAKERMASRELGAAKRANAKAS